MTRPDRQERRRLRREQVVQEREARTAQRQAAWMRRAGRRVFTWRCRRGEAVEVKFDFSESVTVPFDPHVDRVENVGARAALQQVLLTRRVNDDLPD